MTSLPVFPQTFPSQLGLYCYILFQVTFVLPFVSHRSSDSKVLNKFRCDYFQLCSYQNWDYTLVAWSHHIAVGQPRWFSSIHFGATICTLKHNINNWKCWHLLFLMWCFSQWMKYFHNCNKGKTCKETEFGTKSQLYYFF